jgi:DNA invertase Pin-like site-specific DNA recombinase
VKIGYARVSTEDQNLDLQIAALNAAGCSRLFSDHGISGSQFSRPGLKSALDALSAGDTLVVWRLDRLGRTLRKLVELIDELGARNVEFFSLTECINTTSSGGVLIFHVMAALAQFERSLISERTRAGMAAARRRGQHVGRRRSLSQAQCEEARELLTVSTLKAVAAKFDVHPRTLQRTLCESMSGVLSVVTLLDSAINENVCPVSDGPPLAICGPLSTLSCRVPPTLPDS